MKHEYKTILFLVMLTFLSVNCGSESDSSDDDDELPTFDASESADTSNDAADAVSVFEQLVNSNSTGSESTRGGFTIEDACADGDCNMDEGEDDPTVDDCQSGKRACYTLEEILGH